MAAHNGSNSISPQEKDAAHEASAAETASQIPIALQRRNLICYATSRMLLYLAAPVTYIDVMHGTLIDKLGASTTVANLPVSAFMYMTLFGVVVAWLVPYGRLLRPVVVAAFSLNAFTGAVVALSLFLPTTPNLKIGLLMIHAVVLGASGITAEICTWEILGRTMSEQRRGWTLAFAFGVGPLFAVIGSAVVQAALGGNISWLTYPNDYAACFGATAPILGTAALIASAYYVPVLSQAAQQRPAFVPYVFGGLWDFLRQRRFLLLVVGYIIVSAAWFVYTNASLNIREAIGVEPKQYVGAVQGLRFGGKMLGGFLLGFIAARWGAKAAALGTTLFTIAGILWILGVHDLPYLGAFALFGAAELMGVYFPNYCVSASKPENTKRNLSFLYLTGMLIGLTPALHGLIVDLAGFRASFLAGLVAGIVALILVLMLPYRPPRRR